MDLSSPDNTPSIRVKEGKSLPVLSFLLLLVSVSALLLAVITFRYSMTAVVTSWVSILPVGYAFAAGMVASVNPCGFFMLPSYISYHLGTEEAGFYNLPAGVRVLKALAWAGMVTVGFVVVFAVVGAIISVGGRWLITVFPYAGAAIGVAMLGLGLGLFVTHNTLGIMAASTVTVTPKRNLWNVFLYGIAYAVCSLSCTLPIFLVVIGGALATEGMLASFGGFISYALGMGTLLTAVTIGTTLFQGVVTKWVRVIVPYVHSASALFLMGAGAYLIYYWVFYAGLF